MNDMKHKIQDPVVFLTKLVRETTVDAKHNQVPIWRVQTLIAKVLLITKAIYEDECGANGFVIESAYNEHVLHHVKTLLEGTCDPAEVFQE